MASRIVLSSLLLAVAVQGYTLTDHVYDSKSLGFNPANETGFDFDTEPLTPLEELVEFYENEGKALTHRYSTDVSTSADVETRQSGNGNNNQEGRFCRRYKRRLDCSRSQNSPFRSIDGTCNNLNEPYWGASIMPYRRMARSAYADGRHQIRGNGRLPLVRSVSIKIHDDLVQEDRRFTHALVFFGQFLDHDIAQANLPLDPPGSSCCEGNRQNLDICIPVEIPDDDRFNRDRNVRCIVQRRARQNCESSENGQRDHVNMITTWVDASMLYGNTNIRYRYLRCPTRKGMMRGSARPPNGFGPSFPASVAELQELDRRARNPTDEFVEDFDAFGSGDARTNENPFLAAWHILFHREHNAFAAEISRANDNLSSDAVFERARRIMVALWQKIVYNDWLPLVIGPDATDRFRIRSTGFSTYEPRVPGNCIAGFGAAAFRFGHSLVNGNMQMIKNGRVTRRFRLRETMLKASQNAINDDNSSNPDGFNQVFEGQLTQSVMKMDRQMTVDLTNFLFRDLKVAGSSGQDLASRNLNRGRDQGIPAYTEYRRVCGLGALSNDWGNRPREISQDDWNKFREVYRSPVDIDLFAGAMAEQAVNNGIVGPTFACIIGQQFHDLKYGDRYFYTHRDQAGSYTNDQIREIQAHTIGDMVCRSVNVQEIPARIFTPGNTKNCRDARRLNIRPFV